MSCPENTVNKGDLAAVAADGGEVEAVEETAEEDDEMDWPRFEGAKRASVNYKDTIESIRHKVLRNASRK